MSKMALIVQKFGGTSVANIERIKHAAKLVAAERKKNNQVIVVVSAMSGVTEQLIGYAREVSDLVDPNQLAEYDSIISSGEQVTSGLLALELQSLGFKSRSFLGWQAGIKTNKAYAKSRIERIDADIFHEALAADYIPVLAGFQGIDPDNRISTMGRGGSDTSAVAVAAALKAERCDIYTDVTGVYTADPRIVPKATQLAKVSYDEIMEMASLGAKVLQIRAVEMAAKHQVKVQVLSSFTESPGSLIVSNEEIMEQRLITAVAHSKNEAKVTLKNVKNTPGVVAEIFKPLGAANINIDMIIQNISPDEKTATVTFTMKDTELAAALNALNNAVDQQVFNCDDISSAKNLAKVSVIGIGMQDHPGTAQKVFQVMAEQDVNIINITTSEIKISVLINESDIETTVKALHSAFDLDN